MYKLLFPNLPTRLPLGFLACALALLTLAPAVSIQAQGEQTLDYIVAVVDDDVVTALELDRAARTVAGQLRSGGGNLPPLDVLRRQVLERLIMTRLQVNAAQQAGIQVDDATVNAAVNRLAQNNGLSLNQLQMALQADGVSFVLFRQQIREDLLSSRLRQRLVDSQVSVSEQEVEEFLINVGQLEDREYYLLHILIGVPEGSPPEVIGERRDRAEALHQELLAGADFREIAVANSDGRNALEGGDLGWRKVAQIPSIFQQTVINLSAGELSPVVRSSSGFHLIKLEDIRSSGDRQMVTQTRARHILITPSRSMSEDEARLQIQRLQTRILGGEDFAELARSNSDDEGSAPAGGDLGWISPGTMEPVFEQAMNTLAPGELSRPFRTRYGWHLVQVTDRRDYDSGDSAMANQAREAIRKRKADEEWEFYLRRLREEAYVEIREPALTAAGAAS